MKNRFFYFLIIFMLFSSASFAQIDEWRGPGRTGIFNESNLLKEWPVEGPEMKWLVEDLPAGYSSMSIDGETIFLTGKDRDMDVLVAIGLDGKEKWRTSYGRAWQGSFPESRCTPTIDGDRLYVSSGSGDLACIQKNTGKIIWQVKGIESFNMRFHLWGVAESLIVHEDKVFFSPIGDKTTTVALDKMTGETIWMTKSIKDSLAYVSPILINYTGKDIYVNVSASNIYGVDISNGKILWTYDYHSLETPPGHKNAPIINCNTPVYQDGNILVTSGYDHTSVMLQLSEDGNDVEYLWHNSTMDTHHGNVVLLDGYIYGSNWINNGMGNWCCVNWETGELMYEEKWNNKGAVISADGMLYCYDEKRGNLGIVNPTPEKFDLVSSFRIENGSGPHWAHPVIYKGILYVRHGDALMAFNIAE